VPYPGRQSEPCDFLALSYVWGKSMQPSVLKSGRLPRTIPLTISDSMTVVKRLGKRCLWVDSICINQSNPGEKKTQIAIMDAIYAGAFATIIALDGDCANSGLPGVGTSSERIHQLFIEFGEGNIMAEKFPRLESHIKNAYWTSRGWTYQEGLLSRRRIVFTKHQVYYCCNEMECCESVDDAMSFGPSSRFIGSDDTPGVRESYALKDPLLCEKSHGSTYSDKLRVYEGLINNYMPRRLTRDSDALYAISGLLGYLQKDLFPNGFFYGLPMADFPQSMLWHQGDRDDSLQNSFHLALKGTHGRVSAQLPSWSWVGWKLPLKILIPRLGKDED
jgi:hypothetical protein